MKNICIGLALILGIIIVAIVLGTFLIKENPSEKKIIEENKSITEENASIVGIRNSILEESGELVPDLVIGHFLDQRSPPYINQFANTIKLTVCTKGENKYYLVYSSKPMVSRTDYYDVLGNPLGSVIDDDIVEPNEQEKQPPVDLTGYNCRILKEEYLLNS